MQADLSFMTATADILDTGIIGRVSTRFHMASFFIVMVDSIVSKGQWKQDYLAFTVLPMFCIIYYFIVDPVTGYDRHVGYIQCLATWIPQN